MRKSRIVLGCFDDVYIIGMYAVKPKFKVRPANTTAYEGYSTMLHCVAVGDPTPVVRWDKNNRVSSFDQRRFKVHLPRM